MKTKFFVSGGSVYAFALNEETTLDVLPPRIYTLGYNTMEGFHLMITKDKLDLPAKIYGKTPQRVQKCINTYNDRSQSTGILLTGDKGTGKTLLMSLLANEIIEQLDMPVILVKDAHAGQAFTSFIESIGECALVFDEFGKMYESNTRHNNNENTVPQTALLSLMDGVDKTKRMFILTENSELDINDFMLNRPSRIYYHFKYHKLDEESIKGYGTDKGVDDEVVNDIIDLSRRSRVFSFDMLQTIVEEHLRYDITVDEVVRDLNIDTREEGGAMIEILKVVERGTEVERDVHDTPFVVKPGNRGYCYIKVKPNGHARRSNQPVPVTGSSAHEDIAEDQYDEVYLEEKDLAYEKEGKLVYETEEYTFIARDVVKPRTSYFNLF